ncbi:HBL/NHE enterotoxin family protein [Chryseobacterium viscerum]|uniref:Uncharacterized protein n=1 Tax=Chryseobacterium viscerum TaxID=1037377 RepID=A0A316W9H1_9FLAO|nr:HBL/NHE enterotoxin family protein [Chryseobacterium viscerum]PWN57954.1 hypothetical protein C1634_025210 [Chryseobacterium viscerum]
MGIIASLAPEDVTGQKDLLANHVEILTKIRAYSIAVTQTEIHTILNPPPSWFNTLNTNLGEARKHAEMWTNVLEPAITSTIPQAIIDIGNRFDVGTDSMLKVLDETHDNPTSEQIETIQKDFNWILKHIDEQAKNISELQGQFTEFQVNAGIDLTNLTTGNNSIQAAQLDDQRIINDLTADIAEQNAEIAKDNAVILASGLAGGIGLFVGVAVVGLGAVSAGPGAPVAMVIGAFIIVGSIAEMATVISIYAGRLADAQNKLNSDTAELDEEQKQLASLTVMNTSITKLVDLNKDMAQSLVDIADWWAMMKTKLTSVKKDLDEAAEAIHSGDPKKVKPDWEEFEMDIKVAKKDWADFASFARGMQTTVTTIQNQVIDVKNPKAA